MSEKYEGIRSEIYKVIDELYGDASLYLAAWGRKVVKKELVLANKTTKDFSQNTAYQLKIEVSGSSFIIRWLRIRFIRNNGKVVRLRHAVAIPRSGKYTRANFPHAPNWELDMIEELEELLAPIRNQLKNLMKAHYSIIYASRSLDDEDSLEGIPLSARVDTTQFSMSDYRNSIS
jgi:hypothetical protein